jgi:hypothetical protein
MGEKSSEPKWWWIVAFIVALAAIGIPLLYSEYARRSDAEQKRQEQERQIQQEAPRLAYVRHIGPDGMGFTRVTYQNQSLTHAATIQYVTFSVTDSDQLRTISQYHPKQPMQATAPIDEGEVRLLYGGWSGDSYVFYVYPSLFVRAGEPIELKTCIVDRKLPRGLKLTGRFVVSVFNGNENVQEGVTLTVHAK